MAHATNSYSTTLAISFIHNSISDATFLPLSRNEHMKRQINCDVDWNGRTKAQKSAGSIRTEDKSSRCDALWRMLDDDVDDHGTGAVESCLNKACSIAVMSLSLEVVVSCNEEKLPTHHSGPTFPKLFHFFGGWPALERRLLYISMNLALRQVSMTVVVF